MTLDPSPSNGMLKSEEQNSKVDETPLGELAGEIIRLSEQRGSTPVLVTPRYLTLRQQFFLELFAALGDRTDRSIRIDWYRRMPRYFSLIGDRMASIWVSKTNRAFRSLVSDQTRVATIQITASISRPGGVRRELVIGLCDQRRKLPPWTTPIRLGASPLESCALQSEPLM